MKNIKNFRFVLDPSSRKLICPNCSKKTFVGMIDQETGEFLHEYGRCDREVKCGFSFYTYQNGIKNRLIIDIENEMDYYKEPSFHEHVLLEKSLEFDNNLLQFFRNSFGEIQSKIVQNKYKIGTSTDYYQGTVFWQIDEDNRIHGGKIICYDGNGRRTSKINWIHSIMKRKNEISEFKLQQCLFGLQLVKKDKLSVIAIVESEKTACIMSIVYPQFLWLACGAKSEFKQEKLLPIKTRKIIAYPDCEIQKNGVTTYEEWRQKAEILNAQGFNIAVSDLLEKEASNEQKNEGIDIADFFMD